MRPPILWLSVAFGAGLGVGLAGLTLPATAWCVLAGVALVWRRAPVGAALGVMWVAGSLWGGAALRERAASCAGVWGRGAGHEGGGTRAATVRLRDPAPPDGGVVDGDVRGGRCGGTLTIRWPQGYAARGGTTWVVAGRWLGDARAGGVIVGRRVRQLDAQPRGRGALRDRVAERSAQLFGARAPLVDALVIARRSTLDAELRERYTRAGLAHLLSISGLHVGFLAAWLGVLLARLRLRPRARFAAAALVVLGYVWLLGFPAPATRAAVMLILADGARLRQRVVAPRGLIALAALVVLLADPWAVQSVGAWLSVGAITAVIWAGRATERSPCLVRLLAPAAAATLCTAPITAYAFGTVAPVGVFANLVAIPLGGVAVPGLMMALLATALWPALAALLAAGSGLCLALLDVVAARAAALPGGHVIMTAGWPAAALWLGVLAVAWWLWNTPRRRWLIIARVAFVGAIVAWTASFAAFRRLSECRCLTVHFLDVGQGDAVALRTPAGHWVLVDGGPRTPDRDAGRRVVVPFLRRQGADQVSLVVATHGHLDHLGGLPAVLDAYDPRLVLEPGEPVPDPVYLGFLAAVEADGAEWRPARRGDRLELDGVTLEVLSPDSAWAAQQTDLNEQSVVLLVRYGATRILLTGDAGMPTEGRLAGRVGRVTVLKVGHHGSRGATSDGWLAELQPGEAVISVGARNRYGHPAPEVLARLAARGVRVHRTDREGTITLESDGQRVRIHGSHHD
ncbi:MAG TPA: DNA internalization-related competence protein ComEC/Rec2 [Gemmatimonadales bacterium]|jgi:competence protein ComEC|nr:DNA internalization-related competence protein ComEC/Rec2 [Gemmatimonadales bacterium]